MSPTEPRTDTGASDQRMRVLVASDKYKGCLTADAVGAALTSGLRQARVPLDVRVLPLADGGDGSVAAAVHAGSTPHTVLVRNEDSAIVESTIAVEEHTAVVEVATTCGLAARDGALAPMTASSHALGTAIRQAASLGATRIVVGLGGSASTDGGTGMLDALGVVFRDATGNRIVPAGATLAHIATVDDSGVVDLAGIEIIGASDVSNPLYGTTGAAFVFGPQKGATPDQIAVLDSGLRHLADVYERSSEAAAAGLAGMPGAGSAGGIGYGLLVLGGRLVSGADYFLDLIDFDALAHAVDLVITGEGHLDTQTVDGKLISAVGRRSQPTPVWAVVGHSTLGENEAARIGVSRVLALTAIAGQDTSADPSAATSALQAAGEIIAEHLERAALRTSPAEASV